MTSTRKRNVFIDCLKGATIILVVLGHAEGTFIEDFYTAPIFLFCYSFHMFLFMLLSGYLIAHKEPTLSFIKHRFFRLIVPLLIWSSLFSLIIHGELTFPIVISFFTYPMLWYLAVLFYCDILFTMSSYFKQKYTLSLFFVVLLQVLVLFIPQIPEGFKMTAIYFPFYIAGIAIYEYHKRLKELSLYILAVIYPISMLLFSFKGGRISAAEKLSSVFQAWHLSPYFIGSFQHVYLSPVFILYNHYVVAPLGCAFWYVCIKYISKIVPFQFLLKFIGKFTLQIYILSNIFFLHDILTSTLLGVLLPVAIGCIINRVPRLSRILFGA